MLASEVCTRTMQHLTTAFATIGRGALLGAGAGALLAGAYAAVAPAAFGILLALTNSGDGGPLDPLIGAAIFTICSGPFALVLGILPGMLLGAVGGLAVGLLVAPFRHALWDAGAALIGLLVAVLIVAGGNLLWGPAMIEPNRPGLGRYLPYLFWIAGPSLLILGGLPWVGWALLQDMGKWLRPRRRI